MKRIITIITLIAALLTISATVLAVDKPPQSYASAMEANNVVSVVLNGSAVSFSDQQPVIQNGRTLVPVRGVFEQLGFTVVWDNASSTATLKNDTDTVIIPVGKPSFTANGKTITPDVPAQLINGRTMLPLRAICESLGSEVNWDGASQTAVIEYKAASKEQSKPAPPEAAVPESATTASDENTYILPDTAPEYNQYEEAFSSSHMFRDIYIKQYGSDKAIIYDMVAGVMIDMLYNDDIDFQQDINVVGFERFGTVSDVSAALVSVEMDMPFLDHFVFFRAQGSSKSLTCTVSRDVLNYFSDKAPTDNKSYIATRESVIKELNKYRAATDGLTDDEEKLEAAGKMFDSGSVYDLKAPYHAVSAMLTKRGICGSSNLAFAMVGNAVGVPTYFLHVSDVSHAVTLVKPNNGDLKIFDVTFGQTNPKVKFVSEWNYKDKMDWSVNSLFGFLDTHYFPDLDLIDELGGLA